MSKFTERFLDAAVVTGLIFCSLAALLLFAIAFHLAVQPLEAAAADTFTLNRNEWACASSRSIPRFSSTAILVTKKCDVWVRREK